jgi:hypothetical protein
MVRPYRCYGFCTIRSFFGSRGGDSPEVRFAPGRTIVPARSDRVVARSWFLAMEMMPATEVMASAEGILYYLMSPAA